MPARLFRGMVLDIDGDSTARRTAGFRFQTCVVVQNDVGNAYSPTTVIVPIVPTHEVKVTSRVHVLLDLGEGGLEEPSIVVCDQIRTVPQDRLSFVRGKLGDESLKKLDEALKISLSI